MILKYTCCAALRQQQQGMQKIMSLRNNYQHANVITKSMCNRRSFLSQTLTSIPQVKYFSSTSVNTKQDTYQKYELDKRPETPVAAAAAVNTLTTVHRTPMVAYPQTPRRRVPAHIKKPPYAISGVVPMSQHPNRILLHDEISITRMRTAARLARRALDMVCSPEVAKPGVTTDEIDAQVHSFLIEQGAYPSPLNYAGFPKSVCTSINEVVCHGIPDTRPLQFGDVVSFDVSCFLGGVHGDNCATVIVGDVQATNEIGVDWRGVPYKAHFDNPQDSEHFAQARQLIQATRESLYAAIDTCHPGSCLSSIGDAIESVADTYGYKSIRKYRGHGISHEFHCPPFVKHFRNNDKLTLEPGMIFTIEPMLNSNNSDNSSGPDCMEWDDDWTVVTTDNSLAAQFEHTVLITETGVEILTLSDDHD